MEGERAPEVAAAEHDLRSGRVAEAVARLEQAGGVRADAPERWWVHFDLGVAGADAERARAATVALGEGPLADLLWAHARRDPEVRLPVARRALRTAAAPWAHLEAATALAEQGGADDAVRTHAVAAARDGPPFVRREAALLAGHVALADDRAEEAVRWARETASVDAGDPRAPLLEARALSRLGRPVESAQRAAAALALQPGGARAARRLADTLREGAPDEVAARLRPVVDRLAQAPDAAPEVLALAGVLAERAGDRSLARSRYEAALAAGCDPVPVDRHLRALLWRAGARRDALRLLLRAVPPADREEPGNLRREAWRALERAAAEAGDGPAPAVGEARLVALARALVGVGALADARATLEEAPGPEARALRERTAATLAFVEAVRAATEEGYRAPARGEKPAPFAAWRRRVHEAARRTLAPEDAAAFDPSAPGERSMPFLGRWLDHGVEPASPAVAWLRAQGLYLAAGQRAGKPAEAVLLSLASLVPSAEVVVLDARLRHPTAVGYDRAIRSYVDHTGGVLSGAALPDGLWLDADAVRREDHAVRGAVRLQDAALVARLEAAGRSPPAPEGPAGAAAMDDTAGLAGRLARRAVARRADPWGFFEVLRAHEHGHVLDLRRHLPVAKGLPATVGLLASCGFSFERVEARLEGRAQLAALAAAPDPDLALLEMVRGLPSFERTPEVHLWGYRDAVARMVEIVAAHPERYPTVDPARRVLPQLDRLSPDQVRRLAREALGR